MDKRKMSRLMAVCGAAALSIGMMSTAASASPISDQSGQAPLQQRIDEQLQIAPGGVQISPNEIAWDGGKVIMSFPLDGEAVAPDSSPAALELTAQREGIDPDELTVDPQDIHGCPTEVFGNDWYCFYQDGGWKGRRVQWSDPVCVGIGIDLHDVDFDNKASSWVNGGGLTIDVYDDDPHGDFLREKIWTEHPHTSSSSVPRNDKADSFLAC